MKKITTATMTLLCIAGVTFGQGSLTPPGAPGATMKTLAELDAAITGVSNAVEQVETRIDILTVAGSGTSVDHYITQPGSYYLSANIESTSDTAAIYVSTSGVTIDLNGFHISYGSGTGQSGIQLANDASNVTIRDGSISGFQHGVTSSYGSPYSPGSIFKNLTLSNNSIDGIYAGYGARITDCTAYGNQRGIYAGRGSVVSGCTAHKNLSLGIQAGSGSTISDCSASHNSSGIRADGGSTVSRCSAYYNSSTNYCFGFMIGESSVISECVARENKNISGVNSYLRGVGIDASSQVIIKDCLVFKNDGDGIFAQDECFISGNTCSDNGYLGTGAGIHATGYDTRIENNNVTQNPKGIDVDYSGNLIVRNSASGNSTPYDIAYGNSTGTITNSPIGAGAWDNFEF